MKVLKKLRKTIIMILTVITSLLVVLTITHHIISAVNNKKYVNVGQTVKVNNSNMRVYVTGKGDETIVMLSGLGTRSPINDFMPLARMLGENYKVAIVEYPGYGFSDDTNIERTNENIINEVRNALNQVNLKPPYILMPHSISGVYSLYYAKTYPNEVKGIIGIDQSMPNQTKSNPKHKKLMATKTNEAFSKICDFVGVTRIITKTPAFDEYLNLLNASGYYSKEQIQQIRELYSQHSLSNAVINEGDHIIPNNKQLYDVKYPKNIPILSFLSSKSIEDYKELIKNGKVDKGWDKLHEEAITNSDIQKVICLNGSHYLHWSNAKKISQLTKEFLDSRGIK